MLSSIGKQSGNPWSRSWRKKKKDYSGKDLQKRKVYAWNERVRGDGILKVISNVNSITTIENYEYLSI